MGKDWAKGLTAASDKRVARAATAHRGKQYTRRKAIGDCRWPVRTSTTLPIEWSETMGYLVGLTATDGCLITGRRAINFKSGDRELVALYLQLLGRTNRIGMERTRTGGVAFKTQFSDTRLYRWLTSIGLSPRKSLTIGAIDVPDAYLLSVLRGLLDGDGSVINKVYRADTADRSDYCWEYLITQFHSGSRPHLEWIRDRIEAKLELVGYLQEIHDARTGRSPYFHLRYGKLASHVLLPLVYPAGAPCLERKRLIWLSYAARHRLE